MLVLQLAIVVVVLLAVAAVSLAQSQATFNRVEGRRVSALAEQLAANPLVRSQLVRPARDSGPGVAPELAREVFSHGFTTKAAREGERGIGLALTKLVCERHGGENSVANTPEGAVFTARMTVSHLTGTVAEGAAP
ncbi:ATP-binding protein [Streptomyces sp. AK010]|uniref:ATP-binding protein n=1 Tax=Streptomyces sp. AK010 TaxID=2723074 RepID=UPI0021AAB651|nr:ATP-binding protein [Streptomyces sp. AK010]